MQEKELYLKTHILFPGEKSMCIPFMCHPLLCNVIAVCVELRSLEGIENAEILDRNQLKT